MAGPVEIAVMSVVLMERYNAQIKAMQEEAKAKKQFNFEEHLRQQPRHLPDEFDGKEVAYVKRKGIMEQWFAVSYFRSKLRVEAVPTSRMIIKKRSGVGKTMKKAWVLLQTGAPPRLATNKPNSKTEWVTVPIAGQVGSGSWLQLFRLLGIHGRVAGGHEQHAQRTVVPVPMAVLIALLATGAKLDHPLGLSTTNIGDLSSMQLEEVSETTCGSFSSSLDGGVVFVVRSNWTFASMLG